MTILGGNFYSSKNAKSGDVIEFVDAGSWVETKWKNDDGTPKNSYQITVKVAGKEYTMNLNKKNREALIKEWKNNTDTWIGKRASVQIKETEIGGEDKLVIRLTPIIEKATKKAEPSKEPPTPLEMEKIDEEIVEEEWNPEA